MPSTEAPSAGAATPADPTQVVGRRIVAALVDVAISTAAFVAVVVLVPFTFYDRTETASPEAANARCDAINEPLVQGSSDERFCLPIGSSAITVDTDDLTGELWRLNAFTMALGALNLLALPTMTGATLGKLLLDLRVVTEAGERPSFWRHLVRYFAYLFEAGLIGLLVMLLSPGHRRIGDHLASTYVVRTGTAGAPIVLPTSPGATVNLAPHGVPQWDSPRGRWVACDPHSGTWWAWEPSAHRWSPIADAFPLPPNEQAR